MTEYWQSSKRHYCEICKIWVAGHKMNIAAHDQSEIHLGKKTKALRQVKLAENDRRVQEALVQQQLEQITKEAALKTQGDLAMYVPQSSKPQPPRERARLRRMHQKFLASADIPKHHFTAPNYYSQLDFSLDPFLASDPSFESGDVTFAGLETVGAPSKSREADSAKATVVQTHDPAGWVGCHTSDLQVFYHNVLSMRSEWARPANCKFDLSKPPPPPAWGLLSISEYKSVMKTRDPGFGESTLTPTKKTKSETTDTQVKIEELPSGPDWLVVEASPSPPIRKPQETPLEWPAPTEVLEARIGPWKTVEASESAFTDVVNEELHECDYLDALREVDALQATRIESEFAAPLNAEDLRMKEPEMVYTSHATAFKKRRRPRR